MSAIAEHSGADTTLFKAAVLLDDGNIPAIELPHLRVTLFHDLFAAWDVEQTRDFFVDVPFSQAARHRDDVLARVVSDQEAGYGVGHPAENARVPDIDRKPLDAISTVMSSKVQE